MRYSIRLIVIAAGLAFINASHAAEFSPEQRAAQIAPLMDEQTVIVTHSDLRRADYQKLKQTREALGLPAKSSELQKLEPMIESAFTELRKAGATDVYGLFSMHEFPRPSFCIAFVPPAQNPEKLRAIVEATALLGQKKFVLVSGLFVLADPPLIERLKNLRPVERPELLEAFRSAGDTDMQIIVLPPRDLRRAMAELFVFPKSLGGMSGETLGDGFHWGLISTTLGTEPQVTLKIGSKDAQAAVAMHELLQTLIRAAGKMEETGLDPAIVEKLASKANVQDNQVVWTLSSAGEDVTPADVLTGPLKRVQATATNARNQNNLKQLVLAMHNHHDSVGHFPQAASRDAKGRPLLSWRVHLLPYLEGGQLYDEFHLDEPWDSAHNKRLIERMPEVFKAPGVELEAGMTTYLVTTGEHGVFREGEELRFRDIRDGTSNTIMFVDVLPEHAVIWTKPDDLEVNPQNPAEKLFGPETKGIFVALMDGSTRYLPADFPREFLLAMLGPRDGKPTR